MSGPKRKPYRNSQLAVEYLLGHPAASNEQVVQATGASPRSVTRARAMLVATGQTQRSYFDRQHRSLGPTEDSPEGGAETAASPLVNDLAVAGPRDPLALEKALRADHGPALTTDEMKQRYSAIARYGAKTGEFTLEIQAMQALARLDAATGERNRLGPGVPHTREDRKNRVVPIMQAAGPSITAEAAVEGYDKTVFALFLDELGRFMARKVADEQFAEKNRAVPGTPLPEGGQISQETQQGDPKDGSPDPSGESGDRGGVDRGETDPVAGGTGAVADDGGPPGKEGSG